MQKIKKETHKYIIKKGRAATNKKKKTKQKNHTNNTQLLFG